MTNLSNEMQRYHSILFNDETMYRTEFAPREFSVYPPTKYIAKGTCQRTRPPPLKYLNSMSDWKVPNIPFYLFWKPEPIIRGDPNKIQERFEAPTDVELEQVRKTRPQLAMSPATSLDAVKDDSAREMLTSDAYTTTAMYFNREMVSRLQKTAATIAPLPERPAGPRPLCLPKVRKHGIVSPEWRMDSVTWDGRQFRGFVDPTKEFWLKRNRQECKNTAARQAPSAMKMNFKKK